MITYLTHLTICWTILFLSYHFFLKKETFFRYNRWYLLLGLILGMFIPVIDWSAWFTHQPESLSQIYIAPIQYQVHQLEIYATSSSATPWWPIILKAIYITGALLAGFNLTKGIYEIISLRHQATIIPEKGYDLVLTQKLHVPFSFMNSVYWSQELYDQSGADNRILAHEVQHVSSFHSLDILFVEILAVIFWFHPLVYLYRKELKEVHEYEADAAACILGSKKEYGKLLLHQAQSGLQLALANHFFYSQLKNRFKMMTRKPSTRTALLKYLVALPVIGITALIFSFSLHEKDLPDRSFGAISTDTITPAPPARALPPPPLPPSLPQIGEVLYLDKMPYTVKSTDILFVNGEEIGPLTNEQIEEYSEKGYRKLEIYLREAARKKWGNHINENVYSLSSSEPTQENEIIPPNAELFQVVEKMPRFPGCEDMEGSETDKKRCAEKKMQDFLYSNLRYPEISAREGTEGQVLVSFIVEKDGSLSNIKSVRSPDEALSKEALRMVHLMNELTEKWNPGVQRGQKVRVEFMMPIQFKLNPTQRNSDSEKKLIVVGGKTINTSNNTETSKQGVEAIKSDGNHGPNGNIHVRTRSSDTDKALIVIDGVVQEREQGKKAMKDLNPNSILFISVLKDQTAIDKYGESAKDGAIEVFTKTANSNSANSLKGTVTIQKKDVTIESQNDKKADPIIILDGEIMGRSREDITNTISPSSIESIHVLKGQKAIDKYGDQGQDGVIEIISKVPQQLLEKPKLNLSQLNIYPNPVQHQLNIHLEGQEGDYRLEIVDISGISQKTKTHYNHGTSNIDIDIHELKAGMYYLIITSGNSVTTRAFVKQ